ncbi:MAG: threonine-phosphate decarboxylase CobD [Clostridium sp.]
MNFGHGGNVDQVSRVYGIDRDSIVDFSANINPLGLHKNVKEAIVQGICKVDRYPDITYRDLVETISRHENINSDYVLLGNGAGEVIFNIARLLMPRKGLVFAPSFSEYGDALNSVGCKISYYSYGKNFNNVQGVVDYIDDDIDIVFLCNPNNPTGVLSSRDVLVNIVKKCSEVGAVLVVDESFLDFIEDKESISMIGLVDEFKNLIVVKSLTKFYAFPGIRIGYGITSNTSYIDSYRGVCPPWNVNTLAMVGAIAAIGEKDYARDSIAYVKAEGDRLYNELISIKGIQGYKPSVNYIFFRCLDDIDLKDELIKRGILIRDCSNYEGLTNGYYRVAVRTKDENNILINGLKEVLK